MKITILKPYEMAYELNISYPSFMRYLKKDKDFPTVRIGKGVKRFVKENVMEYLIAKKKLDCIPEPKESSVILDIENIIN